MIEIAEQLLDWFFMNQVVTIVAMAFGVVIGLAFYGARRSEDN